MGRTEPGARVRGREELSGNGPAGGVVDGAVERHWGSARGVEGSGGNEAWGVSRVDW